MNALPAHIVVDHNHKIMSALSKTSSPHSLNIVVSSLYIVCDLLLLKN